MCSMTDLGFQRHKHSLPTFFFQITPPWGKMPGTQQSHPRVGLGEGEVSQETFIYLTAPSNLWIPQLPAKGFWEMPANPCVNV